MFALIDKKNDKPLNGARKNSCEQASDNQTSKFNSVDMKDRLIM